ncbi:MAG TPA: protein kinase [Thermodesulfobacteriota bacterium]|nr:protein kinase [Thermodesulfobacteriota bacterium]
MVFHPENLTGKQIDEFRLDEFIAAGAMGMVFKAYDTVLDRTVALKFIPKSSSQEVAEAEKRAKREAQAAARLTHVNIVTIYRYGETEDFHYICMEFIPGKTLAQILLERKRIPLDEALSLLSQVLEALEAADQEHIIHRDIKPSNIVVTGDQKVKVMDFGIAKMGITSTTSAGTVLGTPNYMSPEQISGGALDIRSDLFSAGAVLYQILTGLKPFDAETMVSLAYQIVHTAPPSIRQLDPTLPASIDRIIEKALAKDPQNRYETPRAMKEALESVRHRKELESGTVIIQPGAEEREQPLDASSESADLSSSKIEDAAHHSAGSIQVPISSPGPAAISSVRRIVTSPWFIIPGVLLVLLITGFVYFSSGNLPNWVNTALGRKPPLKAVIESKNENAVVYPGQSVRVFFRIRNDGKVVWDPAWGFKFSGLAGWNGREGALKHPVPPGKTIDFNETVIAPQTPGRYHYGFMMKQGNYAFSPGFFYQVTVVGR